MTDDREKNRTDTEEKHDEKKNTDSAHEIKIKDY